VRVAEFVRLARSQIVQGEPGGGATRALAISGMQPSLPVRTGRRRIADPRLCVADAGTGLSELATPRAPNARHEDVETPRWRSA
jgi:hypothetical protein